MIESERQTERIPYWDNIKGVLIFLVVLGHFLWAYFGRGNADFIIRFIYLFHMPAFIFVSGYFSKSDRQGSIRAVLKFTVIYIIFNTVIMILSYILFNTSFQLISPSYSFWFLISLIIWRLTIKYIGKIKYILLISVFFALLINIWSDVTNVLAISRTIVFYPFFIIGYNLPTEKIYHFITSRKLSDYIKGALLLLCTLLLSVLFIYKYPQLSQSDLLMESYHSPLDPVVRIVIFTIALLMIMSIVTLTPKKPIRFLCKWGKNSLIIFVLHRFITLVFLKLFPVADYNEYYVSFALCASIITLFTLGSDVVSDKFNWAINKITDAFIYQYHNQNESKRHIFSKVTTVLLIIFLLLPILTPILIPVSENNNSENVIHKVMTSGQEAALKDAVSIAFVGDLILLQDQVRKAYSVSPGRYEFDSMFKYAQKYLKEADLAIGIFEGPMAGEQAGYSTSNYDDGLPVSLNYPDSFAKSVKDAGIDLVSTANNHLLDKGYEGAMRTLDVLDEVRLLHVGSYRSAEEKNSIMVIEKSGIRIAVLAYTFGSNGYDEDYFLKENPSLTSILAEPAGKNFKEVQAKVSADFDRIKNIEDRPDLIVVMPHMGTQFSHSTDTYQEIWNDIFIKAGADIVLGDHAHAVQPIEFRATTDENGKEKRSVIVNCPGNFANSYIEKDGDATAISEIYIDPKTKEVICAGVIPMYTQSPVNGSYRALPIYSILNYADLQNEIGRYEMNRVAEVQGIVTSVILGTKLTLDQAQERYYLFPEGYVRQSVRALEITDEMKKSELYKLIYKSKSICFVGDSITAGSVNGGYGWYEPLMAAFPKRIVHKEAWESATTLTLLKNSESIVEHFSDLYVIAIGTNDVRYRDKRICAMDTESYIENINSLIVRILSKNPNADFVLISPWLALDNDPYTKISMEKRDLMLDEYGRALNIYCEKNDYCFINANPAINEVLKRYPPSDYIIDHIHPNSSAGIVLYSEKVLESNTNTNP